MASRRDQLNAYTFARRRTVAAFLRPASGGRDEAAPRPWRAVVPGLATAAVLVAGFCGWGLVRPGAPPGWNAPRRHVLVGSESTTRYVVLGSARHPVLRPVLNLASARLLLRPERLSVLTVDESLLDDGSVPHGPTIGIPYAPDRLPDAADAGTPKLWSVCEQPGPDGQPQRASFVFAGRDAHRVDGAGRLRGDQALFVRGAGGALYLVTADGTAYPLDTATGFDGDLLVRALFGDGARPRQVTPDWLAALHQGRPIHFPVVAGLGAPAGVPGLPAADDRIGTVLTAPSGPGTQTYAVLRGAVARVSPLVAELLLTMPGATRLYGGGVPAPRPVAAQSFTPSGTPYLGGTGWPRRLPRPAGTGADTTLCGVYRGRMRGARPELGVWAGPRYPAGVVDNGAAAYVTPGSGLLYRQVTGDATSGPVYLVTDTGLRYDVPGGDGRTAGPRTLLGYGRVAPVPVPAAFSAFLPAGPTLDPADAGRQQDS